MLKEVVLDDFLIIFDGFDERQVFFLGAAEGEALYRGAFIEAVADAGTESESLFLCVEGFGFGEDDCIVGVKILFEAFEVSVLDETY